MERVWVYGSLRSGEKSHRLMGESQLMGKADLQLADIVDEAWCLASSVRLDWEREAGSGAVVVHGEVYRVDESTMLDLDKLEGYNQPGSSNTYDRQSLPVSDGSCALVYVIRRATAELMGKHVAGCETRAI